MKLSLGHSNSHVVALSLSLVAFAALAHGAAGCTQTNTGTGGNGADGGTTAGNGGDDANDPPHALGTITLGEMHSAGVSSSVVPLVSASFVPDAATVGACATSVSGCQIAKVPQCGTGGIPSCGTGEICSLDKACNAVCTKACTLTCGEGQECYFATASTPACRQIETFDAGAISFAGTTTPITLFPPYSFTSSTSGSPFLAGAQIEVQGSGATGAGFDKFDEKFTATTLLQTSPTLDKIPLQTIFGTGSIPLAWMPGQDTVTVTVSGAYGSATCAADDTAGSFQVPRAVVNAVSTPPQGGIGYTQSVSVSVSRVRMEEHKDAKTKGSLTSATVQPVGFLKLTTSSTESYSYQGCTSGEAMCGSQCTDILNSTTDCGGCGITCGAGYCESGGCYGTCANSAEVQCQGSCVDLTSDAQHCGSCLNPCPSGYSCSESTCLPGSSTSGGTAGGTGGGTAGGTGGTGGTTDCQTCVTDATASGGTCYSQYATCTSDSDCSAAQSCLSACTAGDTTCESTCESSHPTGTNDLSNLDSCLCSTACPSQCASSCAAN
jgi:hypothetical protein